MESLIASYIRRKLPLKEISFIILAIVVAVVSGLYTYFHLEKKVVVNDNGEIVSIRTMEDNLHDTFLQIGIEVRSYDYLSKPLGFRLDNSKINSIIIKRAVPVIIHVDDNLRKVMTYADTVRELMEQCGIVLGPLDRFEKVNLDTKIRENMDIYVIRVQEKTVKEEVEIPFDTVEEVNHSMNKGEKHVVRKGKNGILEKYYKITWENGKEVSKEFLAEKVVSEPVEEIVEYGTVPNFTTSRGELVRYSKVLNMKATAYTSSFEDTGKTPEHPEFGICYTGLKAREGIIAVDPKVIPLWTRVYVEVVGGPDYGFAIAGDIGSAIKGNLIDLYFDSKYVVDRWGCRKVRVYILNEQKDSRWRKNTGASKITQGFR